MAEEFQSGICSGSWWNSMAFPVDAPQRPHQHVDSSSGGLLADSALQMMGFGLSSSDLNCPSTSITRGGEETDLSMSHVGLSLDSQHMMSSGDCAVTCEGNFPSFLVDEADHSHPPQPLFNDGYSNYQLASPDYHVNTHELIDNIPNSSPNKPPFLFKPILQYPTVLWNSPSGCSSSHSRPDLFSSQQSPYLPSPTEDNPNNCLRLSASKPKYNEEIRDSGSAVVKKRNSTVPEPAFKRSRVETPSPLPTFKVRKEKLGDRINALQQLVSPFGKTDTASVLHEAIGYIKFLHDQVSVLSTPYMKNGSAPIQHQQTNTAKWKDPEGPTGNLRNRGLCLVPISSTFPLSSEAAADFCTPTFGGTFR